MLLHAGSYEVPYSLSEIYARIGQNSIWILRNGISIRPTWFTEQSNPSTAIHRSIVANQFALLWEEYKMLTLKNKLTNLFWKKDNKQQLNLHYTANVTNLRFTHLFSINMNYIVVHINMITYYLTLFIV